MDETLMAALNNVGDPLQSLMDVLQKKLDAGAEVLRSLTTNNAIKVGDGANTVWDRAGLALLSIGRPRDALLVHWQHLLALLKSQNGAAKRIHKGTPLVRISDCFRAIGFPVHAKRYLMLTLCEDAISRRGVIDPYADGVHFRLISDGISHKDIGRYAYRMHQLSHEIGDEARFPEALLQRVDDSWITEFPAPSEGAFFWINPYYLQYLIDRLGEGTGKILEQIAQYLMSCMPGCRTRSRTRQRSGATEYDVIYTMEGFELDFRSELGRNFICECKDLKAAANFTTMAKFGRVLDSTRSRFGIIFSKRGITGTGRDRDAEREQFAYFHDTGKVIVDISLEDLEAIVSGENLISLLRNKYEYVRLDLRPPPAPRGRKDDRKTA